MFSSGLCKRRNICKFSVSYPVIIPSSGFPKIKLFPLLNASSNKRLLVSFFTLMLLLVIEKEYSVWSVSFKKDILSNSEMKKAP